MSGEYEIEKLNISRVELPEGDLAGLEFQYTVRLALSRDNLRTILDFLDGAGEFAPKVPARKPPRKKAPRKERIVDLEFTAGDRKRPKRKNPGFKRGQWRKMRENARKKLPPSPRSA